MQARTRVTTRPLNESADMASMASICSVPESDGIVGDKFLLIHDGSDQSPEAKSGDTLPSKEPVEISAMLEKVNGIMDQARGVIDQASATVGARTSN